MRGRFCSFLSAVALATFLVAAVQSDADGAVGSAAEGIAYADAGRIFFEAAGYVPSPISVAGQPTATAAVCAEFRTLQQDCVIVDKAIQGYTSDALVFVLVRHQKEWSFSSAEKQGKLGNVSLPAHEILCASYLVQELVRTRVSEKMIRELVNPRSHTVLAQATIRWPSMAVIGTDTANIITMKDGVNVRCFLVRGGQSDALVSASVTLKR